MSDNKKAAHALAEMTARYGAEIYRDRRRAYAIFCDLAGGDLLKKQRRRVRAAIDSGAAEALLSEVRNGELDSEAIKKAQSALIDKTDMDSDCAKETVELIAQSIASIKPQKDGRQKSVGGYIICAVLFALFSVSFVFGFFIKSTIGKCVLGVSAGAMLSIIVLSISVLIDKAVYFEKCKTAAIAIPTVLALNITLNIALGSEYALIFKIICGFCAVGSAVNIALCVYDLCEKLIAPNIIFCILSAAGIFWWFDSVSWKVWQWIIGVGGGIALILVLIFLSEIIKSFGAETYQSMPVLITIVTMVNAALLFSNRQSYAVIALCMALCMTLCAAVCAVTAYRNVAIGSGRFSLILTIVNIALFFNAVAGLYMRSVGLTG